MPQDYVIAGMFGVADTVPIAHRVDVVWYGNTQYVKKFFAIDATDNAGPAGGTSTTLITGVSGKVFVILGMHYTVSKLSGSTAAHARIQFFSAGVPTNHTGQFVYNIPVAGGVITTPPVVHEYDPNNGPMFVTDSGQNFRVNVVCDTAGQAVRCVGYGCYIEIVG